MGKLSQQNTFRAPLEELFLNEEGKVSESWAWYFRELQSRLYNLGEEKVTVIYQTYTIGSASVSVGNDTFSQTDHGYITGIKVQVSSSGTLPTGLSSNTDYYVIKVTDNTFKLATSQLNADNGTAIDITGAGSGNHTVEPQVNIVKFDKSGITHVIFEYLAQRVTTGGSGVELTESGILVFVYEPTSLTWTKVTISEETPDDAGLTILITSTGQVYYTASEITGTRSVRSLFWRARTLSGKNINYSTVNR